MGISWIGLSLSFVLKWMSADITYHFWVLRLKLQWVRAKFMESYFLLPYQSGLLELPLLFYYHICVSVVCSLISLVGIFIQRFKFCHVYFEIPISAIGLLKFIDLRGASNDTGGALKTMNGGEVVWQVLDKPPIHFVIRNIYFLVWVDFEGKFCNGIAENLVCEQAIIWSGYSFSQHQLCMLPSRLPGSAEGLPLLLPW